MRRSPQDEEWKQLINQQADQNKQIMEQEKVLEQAKKELLIQQYQTYEGNKQRKQQEGLQQRVIEQQEMDDKIMQYRGDQQSRMNSQKQLKSFLSNNYKDQMSYQKLNQQEERKKNREEEQMNIIKAQQSLQQEQDQKIRQRQQARLEMMEFYNSKKRIENEKMIDINQQKELYKQMMDHSAQQQQNKEENYRNYYQQFNQIQSNAAKNFVPFDNNKDKRIQEMIERGIQQDHQKKLQEEELRKQNMISRRLDLKNGLQQQLAQKERNIYQKKQDFMSNQDDILLKSIEQKQYEDSQRNQKSKNKQQYRDHLDVQLAEREFVKESSHTLSSSKVLSTLPTEEISRNSQYPKSPIIQSMIHNPLLNPLPNNIQNPYLLKQLASSPSLQKFQAGRLNYANLASSSIMTPKNNQIF